MDVYDVRILLDTQAARLGGALLAAEGSEAMWRSCAEMARAVDDGGIVDALNHDEAMLKVLYAAGGNPVLLDTIRGLWQRCRPYKIFGARRALEASDATLWSFQPRIVEAARNHDGDAAARSPASRS